MGQPLVLGIVETDSMEPTLEPGDGFAALPPALTGEIQEGDIILFEASVIQGGGPTTHRVEEVTEEGYITRGDANPFTDQDAGEPPVQDAQIQAVAIQIGSTVISVPSVGPVFQSVESGIGSVLDRAGLPQSGQIGIAVLVLGVVLIGLSYLLAILTGDRSNHRQPTRSDVIQGGWILLSVVIIITLPLLVSMALAAETDDVTIVSSETGDDEDPTIIAAGATDSSTVELTNGAPVPQVIVLDGATEGVKFDSTVETLDQGETTNVTLTLEAPPETGVYTRAMTQHVYWQFLPPWLVVLLHGIHPYVALLGVSSPVIVLTIVVYYFTIGLRPIIVRTTK